MVLTLVASATVVFGGLNIANAHTMAPHWGHDLAFFHQIVHSAADGGPWASPLILEPQGFLEMVHTHLVLPLVVGLYKLWPSQDALLAAHSFFVALALWPALRLGETVGGRRVGILAAVAVMAFGPFQAVATADFRPVVLFVPGILGVLAEARRNRPLHMLAWALVALAGRQEASYLLGATGIALLLVPWGGRRIRCGAVLLAVGVLTWLCWSALKPQMFFHINPGTEFTLPDSPELWSNRGAFGLRFLFSGWGIALLSPAALVGAIPVLGGMLTSGHEWHRLLGPGVHHHAFWLPFVLAGGIAGAARLRGGKGYLMLIVLGAVAFPWAGPRDGPVHLKALADVVPADAAVAADYDTIHRLSGRKVLWNIDHLLLEDRPVHWTEAWPIPLDSVDYLLLPVQHPLAAKAGDWQVVQAVQSHVLLYRGTSGQTGRPSP